MTGRENSERADSGRAKGPEPHPRRAELYDLLEGFCRGDLTPDEHVRMQRLVAEDGTLRREYVRYLHMHVCLRRAFEDADEQELEAPLGTVGSLEPSIAPSREISAGVQDSGRTAAPAGSETLPLAPVFSQRQRLALIAASAAAAVLALVLLRPAMFGPQPGPEPVAHGHGEQTDPGSRPAIAQPEPKKAPKANKANSPAMLTRVLGCVWDGPNPLERGALLAAGRYMLSAGMAEITFGSGAVVLAEAPVELEVVDNMRGYVHSGRVVARVPPQAVGFVIETRQANLVDLGTEFGVGVGREGETLVQVFDGLVVAEGKQGAAKEAGRQRLTAGETLAFAADAKPQSLESTPHRFVRRFPNPKDRGQDELVPHNIARYDTMHIVPAPRRGDPRADDRKSDLAVTIDGDLSDWDLSGTFVSRCVEPYGENYHVAGAMMYDDRYLYIGAHVADPCPMTSVIDPETDADLGWKGGSVQVRISTNPNFSYPLEAEGAFVRKREKRPQDDHDQLVHLTMWHFAPKNLPCLDVAYGFDYHGRQVNPPGAFGLFKKDEDGRGYVMEYAIPWSVLHCADRPLAAGDNVAACWNVHWSDEGGRVWQGYLIDVVNPAVKAFTYQKAATWARAILHRQGQLRPGTVRAVGE